MAKNYPGFYLYFDWIDALSTVSPSKAMEIICNMRAYLESGTEPPPMKGTAGSIQLLIKAQLDRARINAQNGRLGGAPSHKRRSEETLAGTGKITSPPLDPTAPYLTPQSRQCLADILEDRRGHDA